MELALRPEQPYGWLDCVADRVRSFFRRRPWVVDRIDYEPDAALPEPTFIYNISKLLELIQLPDNFVFDYGWTILCSMHRFAYSMDIKNVTDGEVRTCKSFGQVVTHAERTDVQGNIRYVLLEKQRYIYKVLFEKIERFERSWNVLETKYCHHFPNCAAAEYITIDINYQGVATHKAPIGVALGWYALIQGYSLRTPPLGFADAQLIVKRLALIHATPIAMSLHKHGKNVLPGIKKMLHQLPPQNLNVDRQYDQICYALRDEPDFNLNAAKIYEQLQRFYANTYTRQTDSPWTTVCFSRCSVRKIFFKRSTEDNTISDLKFVDLGYLQVDSCTSDLILFLLTSTDMEVLRSNQHINDLLFTYLIEFQNIMLDYNIKHPKFESLTEFLTNCGKSALIHMGHIFYEIGRLYYDGRRGETPYFGVTYNHRIIAAYRIIEAMLTLSFI